MMVNPIIIYYFINILIICYYTILNDYKLVSVVKCKLD